MNNFEIGQDGENILIMVSESNMVSINEDEALTLILAIMQEVRELRKLKRLNGAKQ